MVKLIQAKIQRIKAKKKKSYKIFLNKGRTWKTMNPKPLRELKAES
nr:hypothetical protein [uncultured bacterium]